RAGLSEFRAILQRGFHRRDRRACASSVCRCRARPGQARRRSGACARLDRRSRRATRRDHPSRAGRGPRGPMMLRLAHGAAALGLLRLLAACSSVLGPGVKVSTTGDNMAPLVSETGDPEDDMIGARENPRIVAEFGGIYSDRPAEIMLAQIV